MLKGLLTELMDQSQSNRGEIESLASLAFRSKTTPEAIAAAGRAAESHEAHFQELDAQLEVASVMVRTLRHADQRDCRPLAEVALKIQSGFDSYAASTTGMHTVIEVPLPGALNIEISPPGFSTRSRMPTSPNDFIRAAIESKPQPSSLISRTQQRPVCSSEIVT